MNKLDMLKVVCSSREGYDIVTSLRGPDPDEHDAAGYAMKELTVAVIRHFAGVDGIASGAFVNSIDEATNVLDNVGDATELLLRARWRHSGHFRAHVEKGFSSLIRVLKADGREYHAKLLGEYTYKLYNFLAYEAPNVFGS